MNTRKLLITLLTVATLGFSAFGLASCDGKGGGTTKEPPTTHKHEWNEYVSKEATCDEKGEVLYSCYCGEKYALEVSALGHKIKSIQAKAPTCTEIGWYAYEVCERDGCDYTTYEEEPINPNNHNYVNYICSSCDKECYSEGLEYTLSNDGASYSVTGIGTCTDGEIVIPYTYKKIPVTSIGDGAFQNYSSLTEVVIPNSVTSIGFVAFNACSRLTEIVIPNSVTSIGGHAFAFCSSLTKVVIPDSVTSIDWGAFCGCSSLTEVLIPNSVTSIGTQAFGYCSSLTSITFNGTIEEWKAIEKGDAWNGNVPATEVVCTNGRASI